MTKQKEIEYRVEVERRMTGLETKVDSIITNHLPHLQKKVDKVMWILVTTAIGVATSLLVLLNN